MDGPGPKPTLAEDLINTSQSVIRLLTFVLSVVLNLSASVASFTTLTLPRIVYSILHWGATFTLQLNFPRLFVSLVIGGTILSYIWKVRYLNRCVREQEQRGSEGQGVTLTRRHRRRYTTLKDPPLVKDEGFDLCVLGEQWETH